jgi:hypothetical protein
MGIAAAERSRRFDRAGMIAAYARLFEERTRKGKP